MFEFSVAFATSILGGYLFLQRRYPIRSIGFIPTGVALAMLLYASSLPSEIEPLVPALQNAAAADDPRRDGGAAYGIFATSFAAGVGYLVQGTSDRFAWLPSHKVLDEVAYRAVIIGFPIFATMIILGSWWASIAWSRYWGWDPKETAALVTWLTYAVYLHAGTSARGPAGRRRCCWSSGSGWCSSPTPAGCGSAGCTRTAGCDDHGGSSAAAAPPRSVAVLAATAVVASGCDYLLYGTPLMPVPSFDPDALRPTRDASFDPAYPKPLRDVHQRDGDACHRRRARR